MITIKAKDFIIPISALAISVGLIYSTNTRAQAVDMTSLKTNFVNSLAQKLGVSTDQVQTAVSDIRSQNRADAQTRFEERLSTLVTDGKITEDQKSAILAKKAELQSEWDAEQTLREKHRQELEKWASDNGIDFSVIGPMGFGMGGHGMRGMHGDWQ